MADPPSEHRDTEAARRGDRLADLRAALDEIDRSILDAAARRLAIVRRIGEVKAAGGDDGSGADDAPARPIFDRGRERAVHDRAARLAADLGLPAEDARELVHLLVDQSHRLQERTADASARAAAAGRPEPRRICMIGGAGRMARRLAAPLAARGHAIDPFDLGDDRPLASVVRAADVVMVCVPMERAAGVVRTVAPLIRDDALLCDINSLKAEVCRAMAVHPRGEALGLHPMFGPSVHALRRQKVVVCPVREGPTGRWLLGELGALGLELIEADADEHDHLMAVVQVLVHFTTLVMGDALRRSGVGLERSLEVTSPIYRLELAFVGRLFAQDAGLYAEIEMANPRGEAIRRLVRDVVDDWTACIESGDREAFAERFEAVRAWFSGFSGEAMTLSDRIIDLLVREP